MRKLVLGTLFGFVVAATAALAYDVTFPSRLKVQAHALVDELGNVLLGSTPAKIEVTNLPTCGSSEPASVVVDQMTGSATAVNVLTVPAGKRFVLTDYIVGDTNTAEPLVLSDASGARILVPGVGSGRLESGIGFGPGETIILPRRNGMTLQVAATFAGRIEPAS